MYQEGNFWVSQVVFLRANLKNVKSLPPSAFGQLLPSSHRGEFGAGIWILEAKCNGSRQPLLLCECVISSGWFYQALRLPSPEFDPWAGYVWL